MTPQNLSYEIILVVDGSSEDSWNEFELLAKVKYDFYRARSLSQEFDVRQVLGRNMAVADIISCLKVTRFRNVGLIGYVDIKPGPVYDLQSKHSWFIGE